MTSSRLIDNKNIHFHKKFTEYCNDSTSIKIATGYFYVGAFNIMYDDIMKVINHPSADLNRPRITIIMGIETDQPTAAALQSGYAEKKLRNTIKHYLINDLNNSFINWDKNTLEKISSLIANNDIQIKIYSKGKFHAKAYLFEGTEPRSSVAIVGSSNFTPPGLGLKSMHDGNVELNLVTQDSFSEIHDWFENVLSDSEEFNNDLLTILKTSQPWINLIQNDRNFVSPTTLFLIMAAKILNDELPVDYQENDTLTEFQKIGVISADRKIENLNGVLISDAVGLGKTYIAIELIKLRGMDNTLLIVPASLKNNWSEELLHNNVRSHVEILSIQDLSRLQNHKIEKYQNYEFIIIDEAHRLRHSARNHYKNLQKITDSGPSKQFALLTATPINNSIIDLKNLINIFIHDADLLTLDPSLEMSAFDDYNKLHNKILQGLVTHNEPAYDALETIKKILAEVMVLRTRSNIASRYPVIEIDGFEYKFPPPPRINPIECVYPLTYLNIHDAITQLFKDLELPHVRAANPSSPAFIGLYLSHIFKRLESSIHSFFCSLENLRLAETTFKDNIKKHGLKKAIEHQWCDDSTSNNKIIVEHLDNEGFEHDEFPNIDASDVRLVIIDKNNDQSTLTQSRVLEAIDADLTRISDFFQKYTNSVRSNEFCYPDDPKIIELIKIIKKYTNVKILIFSQYIDTVEYIYENLKPIFTKVDWIVGSPTLNQQTTSHPRNVKIGMFAPIANNYNGDDIQILVASDTISEGVNLQDCSLIINYDLPWNPTRLIQRLGRVDRIGSTDQTLAINLLPDAVFTTTLDLLQRVAGKIKIQASVIGLENPLLTQFDPVNQRTIGELPIQEIDVSLEKLRHTKQYGDYEKVTQHTLLDLAEKPDSSQQALDLRRLISNLGLNQKFNQIKLNTESITCPYTIIDTNKKKQFAFALYVHQHRSKNKLVPFVIISNNGDTQVLDKYEILDLYKYDNAIPLHSVPLDLRSYLLNEWDCIDNQNQKLLSQKNELYGPGQTKISMSKLQKRLLVAIHDVQSYGPSLHPSIDLSLVEKLESWLKRTPIRSNHADQFEQIVGMSIEQLFQCDTEKLICVIDLFKKQLCLKHPSYDRSIPKRGDIRAHIVCRGAFI